MIATARTKRLFAVVSHEPGEDPRIHIGFSSRREALKHAGGILGKWRPELCRLVDAIDRFERLPQIWWDDSQKRHRITRYMGACEDCGTPTFRTDVREDSLDDPRAGLRASDYAMNVGGPGAVCEPCVLETT